ncbi:hypothetical protein MMC22_003876 [Lobaria immixta]|nr:hypothetical protein [Lobaria immixta]
MDRHRHKFDIQNEFVKLSSPASMYFVVKLPTRGQANPFGKHEIIKIEYFSPIAPSKATRRARDHREATHVPRVLGFKVGNAGKERQRAPPPEQRAAREAKFDKEFDRYTKRHQIWRDAKTGWETFHSVQLRLREKILATIGKQKGAKLRADLPVRTWLSDLKASTAPPENVTKCSISVEYHRFIGYGQPEWLSSGLSTWLAKWEKLLSRAEQCGVSFNNWLTDVSTMWGEVPELVVYFRTVERKVIEGKEAKHTPASIASAIQQH